MRQRDLTRHQRERRRRDALEHLQDCERRGRETKSPVYAWRAYASSRVAGVAVPEWVLAYFDSVARNIDAISRTGAVPKANKIAPAIVFAFGFKRKGRSNALADAVIPDQASILAFEVAVERLGGHKAYMAYDTVAKKHGVSGSTVAAAWKRFGGDAGFGLRET